MIPRDTLQAIQSHFHDVIRSRAGHLIDEHGIALPDLAAFAASSDDRGYLRVPGMYGGFAYWFERGDEDDHEDGVDITLITESWCRVVGGSAERHEITAAGSRLVASGFDIP